MQLYLVQHGASKSESEDPLRPLTEGGWQTVERLADFLQPLRLPVERIEHSGKLRARQTAEILAERFHPPEGTREIEGIAPRDSVETMVSRLETESKNLMLVGHLPYLSRLITRLLGVEGDREIVRFQNGGLVRLDCLEGCWLLGWIIVPDLLARSA